jgi:hypothetical protein
MNLAFSFSRKDHKLGVFEKKALRRIFVFKKEAVRWGIQVFHNLYFSTCSIPDRGRGFFF